MYTAECLGLSNGIFVEPFTRTSGWTTFNSITKETIHNYD